MIPQDYSNITELLSIPFLSNHTDCDFCGSKYSIHLNKEKAFKTNYLYHSYNLYGLNDPLYGYIPATTSTNTFPIVPPQTTASPYSNYFNEYLDESSKSPYYELSLILSCLNCNYLIKSNKVPSDELNQLIVSVNHLELESQGELYDMFWEHSPWQNFILFKCRPSKLYLEKPFDFSIPHSEIKKGNLPKIQMILNNYLIFS